MAQNNSIPNNEHKSESIDSSDIVQVSSEERLKYLKSLKAWELKDECRVMKMKIGGKKPEILERLINSNWQPTNDFIQYYKKSRPEPGKKALRLSGVNKLLTNQFNLTQKQINKVSMCLKSGIARGYIKIDNNLGLDTFLVKGTCLACSQEIEVTIRDVLYQSDCGINKYTCETESESENESQSEDESDDNIDGVRYAGICPNDECGMEYFVTDMCEFGYMSISCAKYHHHCITCKGFGKCFNDWREKHCDSCNKHYFAGSYDLFVCENCDPEGAKKSYEDAMW